MATPNRKLRAGLATLGLFWTSATLAPGQEAVPPLPASMPVPAPPNAPTFAVLLLSNGRLLEGNVSESPAGDAYEIRKNGGAFPVPKKDVRKRYGSMAELYEDKVAHLPDRDPDERMKLALWCLEQHMEPEAHVQLQAVLAINPGDKRAQRMLANIEANAQRAAGLDREVRAAGAEIVEPAPRGSAPAGIPMPRARSRVVERPVIFDLPPDVAMKRFVEFAWDVHPILQASCASCHNEAYQGDYRLIGGKSRRDWTADVVRANLDATLRHVRRDDPSHSDLVAYAANPHGATPRPAFHGPNDRRYRLLVTWLQSLKSAEAVAKAGYVPPSAPPSATPLVEGFGADRIPSTPGSPTPVPMPGPAPSLPKGMAGQTYVESYQINAVAPGVPPGVRFDPPSLPGMTRPAAPSLPGTTTPVQSPTGPAPKPGAAPPAAANLPPLPPGTPVPPPDEVIPPTNRPKKAKKVDPALLDQLMRSRQQGQP